MATNRHRMSRKTLLLDPNKLKKLKKFLEVDSESEAVRQAIDRALAYREALQAARSIQRRGTFGRD